MHHKPKKNVLYVDREPAAIAKDLGMPEDRVRTLIQSGRRKLKAAREKRPAPAVDPTIFASWNGMMIAAVLDAAVAFCPDDVRAIALESLDPIIAEMWWNDDGMSHTPPHGVLRGRSEPVRPCVRRHVPSRRGTVDPSPAGSRRARGPRSSSSGRLAPGRRRNVRSGKDDPRRRQGGRVRPRPRRADARHERGERRPSRVRVPGECLLAAHIGCDSSCDVARDRRQSLGGTEGATLNRVNSEASPCHLEPWLLYPYVRFMFPPPP